MVELNEQQLKQVRENLESVGLSYRILEDEFFDHICCTIEHTISGGCTFEQSLQNAFADFGEDEMKKLETETISIIQQNSIVMKKMLISLAAGMLLILGTLFSMDTDPPSKAPLRGFTDVSSGFGMRMHPIMKVKKMHKGVDFRAPLGTPIHATGDGIIESVTYNPDGYGHKVVLRHDDEYQSVFAQMTSGVQVEEGQLVKAGDIIGYVGSSGRSTAPHLHYEVLKNGEHVDPMAYLGL